MFYNLSDECVSERKDELSKSYSNEYEVRFVLNLYNTLVTVFPSSSYLSVVILTPYNEQKSLVGDCVFMSRVVPKADCGAPERGGAEAPGVHRRRVPGKGGGSGVLLNRANGHRIRSGIRLGRSSYERELHAPSLRVVRGGQ